MSVIGTALGRILRVIPGVSLRRGRCIVDEGRGVALLQIGDLGHAGEVLTEGVQHVDPAQVGTAARVQVGDVLFAARGASQKAAVYRGELKEAVAGAQLTILRPLDPSALLPEFLVLYLVHGPAQKYMAENRTGSYIPLITKATLENMPMIVPPLEEQREMVAIHQLVMRELDLMDRLRGRRLEWLEGLLDARTTGRLKEQHHG